MRAQDYARKVFESFNYVGVLALELFQCGEKLLLNEMASRVHNTGHWTIEGAKTSQFENHLRAGLGLELGSTETTGYSAMINLIGEVSPRIQELSDISTHVHVYGKLPRPNRKLGHVTFVGKSREEVRKKIELIEKLIS
jgi:5-(carboxyamino)imidazole ribonucleotide synthase